MNEAAAQVARTTADRLAPTHGIGVVGDVEAALHADQAQAPEQYLDPVSLGSLIVAAAALAWQVYTDHRDKRTRPSAAVLTRTLRVTLAPTDQVDPDLRDQIIEITAEETLRRDTDQ